jgi:hypothetical protein
MLEFATYLKETFNQDVSKAEDIIKEKWNKVKAIMKEAFDGPYADKQTALNRIQNDFIDKTIAPSTIDVDFLKNNMEYVVEKINALDEGDIKIIINNDTNKSGKGGMAEPTVTTIPSVTPIYTTDDETDIDMETESAKAKKKGKKGKKAEKEEEEELEEKAEKPEVPEVTDEPEETPEVTPDEVIPDTEPEETPEEKPEETVDEPTDIEAKKLTITVVDNKVTVDPENEDTGLEHKDYEFESPTQAQKFADSLKQFFGEQGFELTDNSEETPEETPEEKPEGEETPEEKPEGEETEDDVISWEDVEDEEVPDEEDDEDVGESIDINKLVGKLVRVGDKWYNVTSIAESKLVCVDKDGNESKFGLTEVEEAEVDKAEEKKEEDEEKAKKEKEEKEKKEKEEADKKEAEEKEEAAEKKEDEKEEVEEALSITKLARRFMFDDDDTVDESETPKMPSVDKAFTKTKEPSAALTATPKKPNEKLEKTNKPETMSKKAPSAALTAKPSKPKEKVETVKTPKVEKKAPPKGNLTAKLAKPNEKIETVKAPSFDAEYNKKL